MEGDEVLSPVLTGLGVADDADTWRAAGFAVRDDDTCRIGTVTVHLEGRGAGQGIRWWALDRAAGEPDHVDGVPTRSGVDTDSTGAADHPNGAELVDHVVMLTPDPERTISAVSAIGAAHRRTRLPDDYDQPMRQDFFRLGEVILELIGPRTPDPAGDDRPARLYGLAHTVADLDATAATLGALLTPAKAAVQPGRRIATLRTRDLGMTVPTAFLSPGGMTAR